MLSVKSPSLFLLRAFAITICILPLLLVRDARSFAVSTNPAEAVIFAAAAEQNARLKSDLAWTFGARRQLGWRSIRRSSNAFLTPATPETIAFAQALADWQESAGLPSTGVLDQQTG